MRRQRDIQEAQENDKKSVIEKNESEKQEELRRQETMWSEVSAEQMKRDKEEPQVQGAPSLGGLGGWFRGGRNINHLGVKTKPVNLEKHVAFTNQKGIVVNKIFQMYIEIFDFISY